MSLDLEERRWRKSGSRQTDDTLCKGEDIGPGYSVEAQSARVIERENRRRWWKLPKGG
jgi:hypothetical protein